MRTNYGRSVSLTELAPEMFVSVSTLSRLFQKRVGISFVQYVKNYRLDRVCRKLAESDESVTGIAIACGFSTASAMNRDFKAFYGLTPKEYREQNRSRVQQREEAQRHQSQSILRTISMLEAPDSLSRSPAARLFVHADLTKELPYRQWRNTIMNIGPAVTLSNPKLREQILRAHRQLSCEYYRLWSLHSRRLYLMGDVVGTVNFDQMDMILDFFVEHNLKLFLDLGPRSPVTRVNEREVITNQADRDIQFASEKQWESFLGRFLRHLVNRYGEHTVSDWVFELSFFLSDQPYYADQNYSLARVWERGVQCIRRYIPEAVIAGPGLPAVADSGIMDRLIRQFFSQRQWPDIFTAFHFSGRMNDRSRLRVDESATYQKESDENILPEQIRVIRAALDAVGYTGRYYITDWNFSTSNRNYVQDSSYRAAYYLRNIFRYGDRADAMGI